MLHIYDISFFMCLTATFHSQIFFLIQYRSTTRIKCIIGPFSFGYYWITSTFLMIQKKTQYYFAFIVPRLHIFLIPWKKVISIDHQVVLWWWTPMWIKFVAVNLKVWLYGNLMCHFPQESSSLCLIGMIIDNTPFHSQKCPS